MELKRWRISIHKYLELLSLVASLDKAIGNAGGTIRPVSLFTSSLFLNAILSVSLSLVVLVPTSVTHASIAGLSGFSRGVCPTRKTGDRRQSKLAIVVLIGLVFLRWIRSRGV